MDQDNHTTPPKAIQLSNLDLALALAARGKWIFPCRERPGEPYKDKKTGELITPEVKTPYTQKGKDDATLYQAIIRAWWKRWPGALVGIYCEKSGFWALDIDCKDGVDGWAALEELRQAYGAGANIEVGPLQTTPSGGAHLCFNLPPDLKIPNNAGKIAPGLDLRSNGYICTGTLPDGSGYVWQPEHGPDAPLTDAPGWLLALIRKAAEKPTHKPTNPQNQDGRWSSPDAGAYWLSHYLAQAAGGRNNAGFFLACQLRDSGLTTGEAESIMLTYAHQVPQNNGKSHYTEREALASLEQAYKAPPREPAHLPGIRIYQAPAALEEPEFFPMGELQADQEPHPVILHTELGNSRRFSRRYKALVRFTKAWGWMIYDNRRWAPDETGRAAVLAKAIVDDLFSEAQEAKDEAKALLKSAELLPSDAPAEEVKALKDKIEKADKRALELMIWALKSQAAQKINAMLGLAESDLPARAEDFDRDPWALNCQNGIINLKTGELQPHDARRMIRKIAPVDYDPAALAPIWEKFLSRIFGGDQELIGYIRRAVGYSLTGLTIEQCFFFLFGKGNNGKSTFTGALAALLGDYYRKSAAATFMQKYSQGGASEGLANLAGARVVIASELSAGMKLDEPNIKDLTGGDMYTARKLYQDEFTFKPALKLWMYGNEKPKVTGTDEGIWLRVRLVPFTVVIPEAEIDKTLPEKLAGELPGILAWAVRGCLEWQREGLGMPEVIKEATKAYRTGEDVIGQFIEDCCTQDAKALTKIGDLHAAYTRWGGDWKIKAFSQELARRGYAKAHTIAGTCVKGLGIETPAIMTDVTH